MNKKINKLTIMLAVALLSSIPCNASAEVKKDNTVQNQQVQKANENTKTQDQVKEEKNTSSIGWQKHNDGFYSLIDGKGNMITSDWCKVGGKWYYFNENGIMQKGWVKSDGKWYCLDNNGNPQFGWISERNNWYHFNADGAMQTGWSSIDGNWYYFNGQGEMATEWKQINGKWYYFDNSGKMLSNTVIDGCTLGSDGKMI